MTSMEIRSIATGIIKNNNYLTLSTYDGKKPLAAPLYYSFDKNYHFYFVSDKNSLHARHIEKNKSVAAAIFDSHQEPGTANGVQIEAEVRAVPLKNLPKVLLNYYKRRFLTKNERQENIRIKKYIGKSSLRFYEIVPLKFYILDPDTREDKRIEVKLM